MRSISEGSFCRFQVKYDVWLYFEKCKFYLYFRCREMVFLVIKFECVTICFFVCVWFSFALGYDRSVVPVWTSYVCLSVRLSVGAQVVVCVRARVRVKYLYLRVSVWQVSCVVGRGRLFLREALQHKLLVNTVDLLADTQPLITVSLTHSQPALSHHLIHSVLYISCVLTLLAWCQEGHPAIKNWVMRCWCGYLSAARCRLFACGPADATAIPEPHHLSPHWNQDWFLLRDAMHARY